MLTCPGTLNGEGTGPIPRLGAQDIARARAARQLHELLGHCSDASLRAALSSGQYSDHNVTARDVTNAADILGPCTACLEGKMTAPPEPSNEETEPVQRPGHTLGIDLVKLTGESLGGHHQMLFARDYGSAFFCPQKRSFLYAWL